MTLQEALAKVIPTVRNNIRDNLSGKGNRQLKRNYKLDTPYLKQNPRYWKYPYPRTRALLNSIKVVQLRNTIVIKAKDYGLFLETGTKRNGKLAIRPPRPWFSDAIKAKNVQDQIEKELGNAFADDIMASLQIGLR